MEYVLCQSNNQTSSHFSLQKFQKFAEGWLSRQPADITKQMRGVSPVHSHSLSSHPSPFQNRLHNHLILLPKPLHHQKCRKQYLKNRIVTRLIFLVPLHHMNPLLLLQAPREILSLAQIEAVIATMISPMISSTPPTPTSL